MERIVLEIDPVSAYKWQQTSFEERQKFSEIFAKIISRGLDKKGDDFWTFVDRISQKAAEQGMTEEKLAQLLDEE